MTTSPDPGDSVDGFTSLGYIAEQGTYLFYPADSTPPQETPWSWPTQEADQHFGSSRSNMRHRQNIGTSATAETMYETTGSGRDTEGSRTYDRQASHDGPFDVMLVDYLGRLSAVPSQCAKIIGLQSE